MKKKICIISDIHMKFKEFIPKFPKNIDLLIIAGDILEHGNPRESEEACNFLLDLQTNINTKEIIWVLGNHDYYVAQNIEKFQEKYPTIIFKNYDDFTWNGIKFFVSGFTQFYNFNFANFYCNREEEKEYMLPKRVPDIIITHSPPSHIEYSHSKVLGDMGSKVLTEYLNREKIKYCFSGHLHLCDSKTKNKTVNINGCKCINVSSDAIIMEL